jgi:hypothetical protein
MQHHHYIFTGTGLSAMMTVYEMVVSGKFKDKSILLIDENAKKPTTEHGVFGMKKGISTVSFQKLGTPHFSPMNIFKEF